MGHPSRAVTDALVRSGQFGKIPMCDERDKFCEKCARAAFYRPSSIKGTSTRSPYRGAKWHVDLAGPFPADRNGHQYTMNMVDDCSGMLWGTTLKSKDEAVKGFKEFLVAPGATRFLVLHMVNLTWRETASSNPARGTRLKNGPWIQPFAVLPE